MKRYILPFMFAFFPSGTALASNLTYTYDALGRLTGVVYDSGITVTYTYDAMGNRTGKTVAISPALDTDGDGVPDVMDACPFLPNDPLGDPCNPNDCADATLPDAVGDPCVHNDCADLSLQDGVGNPCVHNDCPDLSLQDVVGDPCVHDDFAQTLPTPVLFDPASGAVNQPNNVMVDWLDVPGAVTYHLFVSSSQPVLSALTTADPSCPTCVVNDTVPADTVSFYNIPWGSLQAGTTYYWMVRASAPGVNSAQSAIWSFTVLPPYFPPPSFPSPPDGATNQLQNVMLDWSDTPNATVYRLFVAGAKATLSAIGPADDTCAACVLDDTVPSAVGSFYNLPWGLLSSGTTYYWMVRATSPSLGSVTSAIWSFTTKPDLLAAPVLLSPGFGAVGQAPGVMLDWSDALNASSYRIFIADSQPVLSALSGGGQSCGACLFDTTTAASTGSFYNVPWGLLSANTTYYWMVRAGSNGLGIADSPIWPFTTSGGGGSGASAWMNTLPVSALMDERTWPMARVGLWGRSVREMALLDKGAHLLEARPTEVDAHRGAVSLRTFERADQRPAVLVATDAAGEVIMAGSLTGSPRHGLGAIPADGAIASDVGVSALVKLDAAGHPRWTKRLGNTAGEVYVTALNADPTGQILVAGRCGESVEETDEAPRSCPAGFDFVARFDADGEAVQSRADDTARGDADTEISGAGIGEVVAVVCYPGARAGEHTVSLTMRDAQGAELWRKSVSVSTPRDFSAEAIDLRFDHEGGAIVYLSAFEGTIDFGGGPVTTTSGRGVTEAVVAKLGPEGDCRWSLHFGSSNGGAPSLEQVAVDGHDNLVLAGSFTGTIDFGGGSMVAPPGRLVPFVVKLSADGSHLFSQVAPQSEMTFSALAFDEDNNLYVTGRARGAAGFGGAALGPGDHLFIAKFFP
jgi:YD repeat-containing protein